MQHKRNLLLTLIIITLVLSGCVRTIGSQEKTAFKEPFPNTANAAVDVQKNTITIPLRNNLGEDVRIQSARGSGYGDCKEITKTEVRLAGERNLGVGYEADSIPKGSEFTLYITCKDLNNATDAVKTQITFNYVAASTRTIQPHTGTVETKI